jgi:hypothetical protein
MSTMEVATGTPANAASEAAPQQPPTATPQSAQPQSKGPDLKGLQGAVQQAKQKRQQELSASKQMEALRPLQEVEQLVKQGKLAEAFQRLAGQDRLTEGYQQLTEAVLGTKDEEAKLAALPKSVREQLEELRRFREEATGKVATVEQLQAELKNLQDERDGARKAFEAREREATAVRVFTSGLKAVESAEGLELLSEHPENQQLIEREWTALLTSKRAEFAVLSAQDKHAFAEKLVLEAAKAVQQRLEKESEWLLNSGYARSKLLGNVKPVGTGKAPLKSSAKSTPAPTTSPPPRTSPPGSLGEPSGVDLSKLPYKDRVRLLREEERRGFTQPR